MKKIITQIFNYIPADHFFFFLKVFYIQTIQGYRKKSIMNEVMKLFLFNRCFLTYLQYSFFIALVYQLWHSTLFICSFISIFTREEKLRTSICKFYTFFFLILGLSSCEKHKKKTSGTQKKVRNTFFTSNYGFLKRRYRKIEKNKKSQFLYSLLCIKYLYYTFI